MKIELSGGRKYTGNVSIDSKPNGHGTMEFPNGAEYFGNWKDGKFHGDGNMMYSNGYKYIGNWKDGKFHGNGLLEYPDGKKVDSEWYENKKHGEGVVQWPDGRSYKGYFKNNKQNGRGEYRIPGRSKYIGEWVNNKKHGKGSMSFSKSIGKNGELYIEGEWEENKFCSGSVISCTVEIQGDFPISVDNSKNSYNRNEYIELTRNIENKIKRIIKQMMNSNNQALRKYGELISNGDKYNTEKFKIIPNVEVRSYAVTRIYRDLTTKESTNGTLSPEILFNPFITMTESDEQIAGSLAHEAAHVKYGHLNYEHHYDKESRLKDYNLSNIADDLIINEDLRQAGIKLENALFLDDQSSTVGRRSWRQIILDTWGREILENDLTEDRIYETLIKRRNEFNWNI